MRFRPWVVLGAALACLTALTADQARAAATVHRLSLVLSGMPTSINGKEFNDEIAVFNRTKLDPVGYEHLKALSFGWMFDGELRYFVRPNFAVLPYNLSFPWRAKEPDDEPGLSFKLTEFPRGT